MIKTIRAVLLTLIVIICFVSCSREQETGLVSTAVSPDEASQKSQSSEQENSFQAEQLQPVASPSEQESESQETTEQGDTLPAETGNRAGELQQTLPAKGVEERRSSDSALAKGDINFDDLKFDLAKDAPFDSGLISDDLKQLDGRDVTLRGYILPSTLFSETNISQFVLVRDNQECCFGPGAALYDCVIVEMVEGNTTDFVTRPVTVAGKFVIDTESYRYPPDLSPNGATHMAIFRIEGMDVE